MRNICHCHFQILISLEILQLQPPQFLQFFIDPDGKAAQFSVPGGNGNPGIGILFQFFLYLYLNFLYRMIQQQDLP